MIDADPGSPASAGSSSPAPGRWRIACDTGGTFTDCYGVDPEGRQRRAKVLSTGAVRGEIVRVESPDLLWVEGAFLHFDLPADGWSGAQCRVLPRGSRRRVMELRRESGAGSGEHPVARLRLAAEVLDAGVLDAGVLDAGVLDAGVLADEFAGDPPVAVGQRVEIQGEDEAPILGARLLTGTALDSSLPPLDLRIATTRGTNALLEHNGARVALFITAGFADLLRIGTQQRPDLFALDIRRPEPLFERVVEVAERLDARGEVLRPLKVERLREQAEAVLAEGVGSAAVVLAHSWRRSCHEEHVEVFLRDLGFRHVVRSSALTPRLGLLDRAQTTVAEAYLGPVIRRYVGRVASPLAAGSTLRVLNSAGGLVGGEEFRAVDSLLSGPAGGVVGAAAAGRRSGFGALLTFDMGGTSTDVSRVDGEVDLRHRVEVGDAGLLVPAVAVETVAAGGGSICSFDGHRLRVGPESAGATPGPACYGAGGPLTLTDVNLLLGRLGTRSFEIPLDPESARDRLRSLLAALGSQASPGDEESDEVLASFLRIADERMAGAMRAISVARGYDPREHTLIAFGGAGAQHACAVAQQLGVQRVLVPEAAALLSAVGLAEARVEALEEEQVLEALGVPRHQEELQEHPRDDGLGLGARLRRLERRALRQVRAEGVAPQDVEIIRREAALRWVGQESSLTVPWPDAEEEQLKIELREAFHQVYEANFGYRSEERPLEIESLRVVAASQRPSIAPFAATPARSTADAGHWRRAFLGGARQQVPVYRREDLLPGERLEGPALVEERHSTTVVEAGWRGALDTAGALVLQRFGEQR
ncbi:MAG: hydantoinase/oxoprolinase family protein [Acidobacteriota bacterium]